VNIDASGRISDIFAKLDSPSDWVVLKSMCINFITIDTNSYQDLIFELKRIGNNINQIARSINYSNLITEVELDELRKGIEELIVEVEKDFLIRSEKLRKFYGHH